MPGFCTRLASICRAEVHQRHAHVHQTVMMHQTLQWHPLPAGKGGQLSFTKARAYHFRWAIGFCYVKKRYSNHQFQFSFQVHWMTVQYSSQGNWNMLKTCWEIYLTFVLLLVKSFQTLGCDLQCVWDQERYLLVVRQYISAQTSDQPWHFAAYLKQCTFVLGSAMVVASISETMQFCRHVRAFLLAEWGNKERGFVCQMSLSVQSVHTTLSPLLCLSGGDTFTRSWPYFGFVIDCELANNNNCLKAKALHNRG